MSKLEDIRKTLPYGTLARIAEKLGVTQSKITRVVQGKSHGPEIVIAILEVAEKINERRREAKKRLNDFKL